MKQRRHHPDPGRGVSGTRGAFSFTGPTCAAVLAILERADATPPERQQFLDVAEHEGAQLVAADASGKRPAPDQIGVEISETADLARALRNRLASLHDQSASFVFEGYVMAHGRTPDGNFPNDPSLLLYLDGIVRACERATAEFRPKAHRHHPDPAGLAFVTEIAKAAHGLGVTLSASPNAQLVKLAEVVLAELGREGKGRSLVKSAIARLEEGTP